MFGQKGMQQGYQSNSQFRPTAVKDIATAERAIAPPGITQSHAKKRYNTAASAIANFGAPTRSVDASTGDGPERDK